MHSEPRSRLVRALVLRTLAMVLERNQQVAHVVDLLRLFVGVMNAKALLQMSVSPRLLN